MDAKHVFAGAAAVGLLFLGAYAYFATTVGESQSYAKNRYYNVAVKNAEFALSGSGGDTWFGAGLYRNETAGFAATIPGWFANEASDASGSAVRFRESVNGPYSVSVSAVPTAFADARAWASAELRSGRAAIPEISGQTALGGVPALRIRFVPNPYVAAGADAAPSERGTTIVAVRGGFLYRVFTEHSDADSETFLSSFSFLR